MRWHNSHSHNNLGPDCHSSFICNVVGGAEQENDCLERRLKLSLIQAQKLEDWLAITSEGKLKGKLEGKLLQYSILELFKYDF